MRQLDTKEDINARINILFDRLYEHNWSCCNSETMSSLLFELQKRIKDIQVIKEDHSEK